MTDLDIKVPEAVLRRRPPSNRLGSQKTNGTTNAIPYPKGLAGLKFTIPPEEVAETINDMREAVPADADPVEAVQFAKTRSIALLGAFTGRREPEDKWTPEGIAEAEQIAEVVLAGLPRKDANGETIQMSIPEAFALFDEQDKAKRRGLEPVSLSPPPTFPKVDLPLAITSKNGFSAPDHPSFVTFLREILATIADPVEAAASAKDMAIMLMKDLEEYSEFKFTPEGEILIKDPKEYSEFKFTPEEITEAKRVAEILLADLPRNQQHITKESDKDQQRVQARLTLQRHSWLKPYLAGLASPPKKANGAAPVNSSADEPTGLAEAFAAPKASKVPPQVAGPVVPKDDHMGRSRIYRKEKRPNLCHYRDDFYDYEGGHYAMIDDHTIEANLYSFLDKCRKQVLKRSVVGGGGATGATGAAAKRKATAQATIIVPFEPDMKSIHETTNALKAVGHVLPTIEQPYWLDGRTGPDPAQLICFPNGILNLSTNQFMPPEPMLFTSHGVAFDYDPNAPEPIEWLKFLKQVFDGEQDQIDALQEMFGYCVSSDVSQEKVFMSIGPKRSGKDTKRHTLQSLISPKAVCGPTLDSMGTNFGMSAFIGKQLAIVGDMRLGSKCDRDLLAENILKLSGRGLFTIDRKHKDHWTGPLPCKLFLISNEMPKIKDTSGALASRSIIFQTRVSFYGREDPHLFRDKIRPELPGILNWALEGLWRMHQRGSIAEPACSIEAREELAREGSPIMAFVQEHLTLDAGAVVNKDVMYSTYLDYAEHNGLHRASKSWFFRDLETATAGKVKAERVQKDGERVHNIVGAKISNPPPERPRNDHRIVVLQPAMPATLTAADVGEPTEIDAKIDAVLHATLQGEAGDNDPTNRA